jgi:hypothetical protein
MAWRIQAGGCVLHQFRGIHFSKKLVSTILLESAEFTYLSFVNVDAHWRLVASSLVFGSPHLRVLDDVAAGEWRICPLQLVDALAWFFFGIGRCWWLVMLVMGSDDGW